MICESHVAPVALTAAKGFAASAGRRGGDCPETAYLSGRRSLCEQPLRQYALTERVI